eukprot:m.267298 g.267298  ORF g.267298 m.267298 type:complete len:139 (-) comp54715_c0_seq6:570-986(-)
MIEERIAALHESGAVLMEKFGGSFAECVRQSNHSSQALLQLITENFPLFRDWLEYKGRTVYFLKRAQLLIGEIWRLYDGAGLGHFHDIHALTMFADYRSTHPLSKNYLCSEIDNPFFLRAVPSSLLCHLGRNLAAHID